jgi:transposase
VVRMVRSMRAETGATTGRVRRGADQLGNGVESVRSWVKQADIDEGAVPGVTSEEAARAQELEQENRELRRANESLKRAASFLRGGTRPPVAQMTAFIDQNKHDVVDGRRLGVELTCEVLQVARPHDQDRLDGKNINHEKRHNKANAARPRPNGHGLNQDARPSIKPRAIHTERDVRPERAPGCSS